MRERERDTGLVREREMCRGWKNKNKKNDKREDGRNMREHAHTHAT